MKEADDAAMAEPAPRPFPAWGKTDDEGRPAHHLAHHSMDVAAVLEGLLRHPVIAERVNAAAGRRLTERERGWLAAFAFLHDVGKLSPAFQAKAWPEALRRTARGHLEEGVAWLNALHRRSDAMGGGAHDLLRPLMRAGSAAAEAWLGSLFAHHGRPVDLGTSRPFGEAEHYDWRAEEARMGEALRTWFPDVDLDPDVLRRPSLVHLFAGLLALADWIGSDPEAFPFELHLDPAGYAVRSRARATTALREIGFTGPSWPEAEPSFRDLTTFPEPRGMQAVMGQVPLDQRLVILEAETGSGKTEAALWRFARLRSAGHVDALYFAVPTRAAASQLHRRIDEAMRRVGGPEAILAVPGQLRAGEATGRRLPGFKVLWDDEMGTAKRRWAAEHATRYLAAPVAVGTVDQALMGALRVKHAHMRAAAASRSLLVIDEVHASDAYMNAIARRLVRDHLALGGHALLMSATLGSKARAAWLDQAPPDFHGATGAPYPAAWTSHADTPLVPPETADQGREKRVQPVLIPTMDPAHAAALAAEAAAQGARVLVIRNTVDAAVATWRALVATRPDLCLQAGGAPVLHHSRFAAEDRRLLDRTVEAAFGKGAASVGVVAIGTQTLEQSLDIDADLLISDLCPMDVLLQRIGRLHRHQRSRPPGFEVARALVLAPEKGLERLAAGPAFENGLGAWQGQGVIAGVYLDLRGLEATRRLVAEGQPWTIPFDNRRLVEAATHDDALGRIEREMGWEAYTVQVVAKALAEAGQARDLALDRSKPFPKVFPDAEETVQTRLGARGPVLELPKGTLGPFGQAITRLTPPAWWCRGLTGEEAAAIEGVGEALRIAVGELEFLYGREGLRRGAAEDAVQSLKGP